MSTSKRPRRDLYLGIDGGGTKTLAVVVDGEGRELGRAMAGCANYIATGRERTVANVHAAAREAVALVGGTLPVRAAWAGLAGVDWPADRELLLPHLSDIAGTFHLENDAELVLAGLPGAVGLALIAGTGSIAIGRDVGGQTARTGGWGHLLGDEGSGYDLGIQALRSAARAADGRGPQTSLLSRIIQAWNLPSGDALLTAAYQGEDKARIAALASSVFAAAREDGDREALRIIRHGAAELALAVAAVARQLHFPGGAQLALGGGLLARQVNYRQRVVRRIGRSITVTVTKIVDDPALVAARAARGLCGDGGVLIPPSPAPLARRDPTVRGWRGARARAGNRAQPVGEHDVSPAGHHTPPAAPPHPRREGDPASERGGCWG